MMYVIMAVAIIYWFVGFISYHVARTAIKEWKSVRKEECLKNMNDAKET